jgi:soluble lytic murein transglycosylase
MAVAQTPARGEAAAAPSRAIFRGGGSLEIERAETRGEWVILHLNSGGEMAVPAGQLIRVEILSNSRAPRTEAPAADGLPIAPVPAAPAAAQPHPTPAQQPSAAPAAGEIPSLFRSMIGEAASTHHLHPELVAAMVKVESNFDPGAVSRRGALGLLQLMPDTARRLGVADPFDPRQNLEAGARYFRSLLDQFDGDTVLALAAYNAGEEAVRRYGGLPPFSETRAYVDRVLTHFARGF